VTLTIAFAQVNPTVGDVAGNTALVRRRRDEAAAQGADLVVFPELVLVGYPPEDLVLRPALVDAAADALRELERESATPGTPAIVVTLPWREDGRLHNTVAFVADGRTERRFKCELPNYGVFDEKRVFEPGPLPEPVLLRGVRIGLPICEDIWLDHVTSHLAKRDAQLLIVPNGSPFEVDKFEHRLTLARARAAETGTALAYVNQVGGQDELVFDGDSMIVSGAGELLARGPQFADDLLVTDLDLPEATAPLTEAAAAGMRITRTAVAEPLRPAPGTAVASIAPRITDEAEIWSALVLGLRDYTRKNGFTSVCLQLSGGIDSAVVAAIAVDAVGPANVVAVSLPSRYSSEHSKDDAADLAKRTGLEYRTVPIAPMVASFMDALHLTGLAEENLQARVRGVVIMGVSNQEGHLVLTTGNKSELAVGYSTLYGDSVGGFNPLKDVPKTLVWKLARWRNAEAERHGGTPPIPENSISKPPSAELRPDQVDSDSLPDYPVLDAILAGYVDGDLGRDGLIAAGHDPAAVDRVLRLVDVAEYKRRQSAPGTKISIKAFGRDRRLPITNRFREQPGT
jgi:NAD+ synthase (glutamine-hydrolysing)